MKTQATIIHEPRYAWVSPSGHLSNRQYTYLLGFDQPRYPVPAIAERVTFEPDGLMFKRYERDSYTYGYLVYWGE